MPACVVGLTPGTNYSAVFITWLLITELVFAGIRTLVLVVVGDPRRRLPVSG